MDWISVCQLAGAGLSLAAAVAASAFGWAAWKRTEEYPDLADLERYVEGARKAAKDVRTAAEEFEEASAKLARRNQRAAAERVALERVHRSRVAAMDQNEAESEDAPELIEWLNRAGADA